MEAQSPPLRALHACCRTPADAALLGERARVTSILDRWGGTGRHAKRTPHCDAIRAATARACTEHEFTALRILATSAALHDGHLLSEAFVRRLSAFG